MQIQFVNCLLGLTKLDSPCHDTTIIQRPRLLESKSAPLYQGEFRELTGRILRAVCGFGFSTVSGYPLFMSMSID